MKTLVIIGLCMFSFGTFAQTQAEAKTSSKSKKETTSAKQKKGVTFKTIEINRADIPFDSQEPFVFEFKNTGSTPLIVTNVQTSCGCTTAEKPTEPVAKGKSSKIVVKYDTKRVGNFTKTITVTTNSPTEPTILLTIKGNVLAADAQPASKTAEPKQ
jgi:hypothetical protein